MFLSRRVSGAAFIFIALGAAAPAGTDWSSARTLDVSLSSFSYDPSTITMDHGARYVLHLSNTSSGGHDFAAKDFFAKAEVAPEDAGKVADGSIEVDGEASVDVHLIAPPAGTYKVRCTHFMHTMFGMTGKIVVR